MKGIRVLQSTTHYPLSRFRFPPATLNAAPRRLLRVLGLPALLFLLLESPGFLPLEMLAR